MSVASDILHGVVGRIEVRTSLGPNLDLDDPFAPSTEPSLAVRILQPQITIYDRDGSVMGTVAPAGDPGTTKWPIVAVGLGVLVALALRGAIGR